ncbi:MAG: helix-turn-helix domain-containing protein [Bacteroidota bacterium]|nr:helix-turn-helix domain-containing protein [Bacteroidota bacterium]
MKYKLLLPLLLFCVLTKVQAQGARLFTSADGLPGSQFIFMNQDSKGNIWICNYGGLARFDGFGLTAFYEARGQNRLRSNSVYRLTTDPLGQYWVGTTRGLQLFHPEKESFEHIRLEKDEDDNTSRKGKAITISDIILLPGGKQLLLGSGIDGFYIIDIRTHKVAEKATSALRQALKNIVPRRIYVDSKSRLWVVGSNLEVIDLKSFRPLPINSKGFGIQSSDMEITDFLEDKVTHTLLICDKWNGVLVFDEGKRQLRRLTSQPTKFTSAQCLIQRRDGTLLVGCENNGIGKIELAKNAITDYKIQDTPLDLAYCKIHSMIEDRWGNLYIGIYQKGMLVVPSASGNFNFQQITGASAIPIQSAVTSFNHADNGNIMVSTDGNGVFYGKNYDNLQQLPLPSFCNNAIQHMVTDPTGRIWIATYGSGLYCYDRGTVKKIPDTKDIINKNSCYLECDPARNVLYIANIGTGLNRIDLYSGEMSHIAIASPWVFALKLDSKGRLWIGSSNCDCYDPNTNRLYKFRLEAIDNSSVRAFLESKGLIYIGTNNGLFVYNDKNNSCRHYSLDSDNKAISVLALAAGNDNAIWMSTNKGIVRFDPKSGSMRLFASYDIRKIGDFHSNAVYCYGNGTIAFGGDNGIITFNPVSIINSKTEWNPIHFSSLNVNGKSITYDFNAGHNFLDAAIGYATRITLPYNQNSFSIRFTTSNYAASSQLRYVYQLKGYESVWHSTTADNPLAVYNQLPPGHYTLRVQSIIEGKNLQATEASIEVIITSPWYWSWWSKLCYFIILLSLVYSQYRTYQIRQRSKKRLRTVIGEMLRIKENYLNVIQTQQVEPAKSVDSGNDKLKKKVMDAISSHISDAGFGVEELSHAVALSRVHLYRRTKELFGSSPNDLIKSVRMKKAGLMLIQGKISISEVAYEVGFSEPSYFSKSFKSYFNMSPKDFVARYRDNANDEIVQQLFEL